LLFWTTSACTRSVAVASRKPTGARNPSGTAAALDPEPRDEPIDDLGDPVEAVLELSTGGIALFP
jgi:hypothetical protein